jgi:hypothetical protein
MTLRRKTHQVSSVFDPEGTVINNQIDRYLSSHAYGIISLTFGVIPVNLPLGQNAARISWPHLKEKREKPGLSGICFSYFVVPQQPNLGR